MAAVQCDVCTRTEDNKKHVICDECFEQIQLKLRELQGKVLTKTVANSFMNLLTKHNHGKLSENRSTTQKPRKSAVA